MTTEKHFLGKLFGQAQGDRTEGARYIAKHAITAADIANLTPAQIDFAFAQYQKAHAANGIDFTTDRAEFEANLRQNLSTALAVSILFK